MPENSRPSVVTPRARARRARTKQSPRVPLFRAPRVRLKAKSSPDRQPRSVSKRKLEARGLSVASKLAHPRSPRLSRRTSPKRHRLFRQKPLRLPIARAGRSPRAVLEERLREHRDSTTQVTRTTCSERSRHGPDRSSTLEYRPSWRTGSGAQRASRGVDSSSLGCEWARHSRS